jgi:amino-acid N-acetyltransferase
MAPIPHFEEVQSGIRKASLSDLPELLRIINAYAAKGIMLPRTEFEMAENIRDFTVAFVGGTLAGCGALHLYTPQMAEVRSLAVAPECQCSGAGRKIVESLELEARAFGLAGVFAFTYIPRFFEKLGFREIDRGELPLKAWKDCLRCPKFSCCDEIAVIKYFDPSSKGVGTTHTRASSPPDRPSDTPLVQLPQVRNPR